MFNNISIRKLVHLVTMICGFIFVVVVTGVILSLDQYPNLVFTVILMLLGLVGIYITLKTLLERVLFRKIKVIYKMIHDSKMNKSNQALIDFDKTSLEDVNMEVLEWAIKTEERIKNLSSLEEYRKSFVGNISHELKTPIFSIQGYLYTLIDGGLFDETINIKYLKRAAWNADRLQNIVEDLEEIGKLESGKLKLNIEKFDLRLLITEVFQNLELMANEESVELSVKVNSVKNPMVEADREMVRQILINLITNSIKYGKEGGNTKIGIYDLDKNYLIEVSDNGIGISEEHLKHLFDRFYRVDSSRSRKQGGSGLGLSIVKHIVEAHQQTINVRSTIDVGSTFGFTLKKG